MKRIISIIISTSIVSIIGCQKTNSNTIKPIWEDLLSNYYNPYIFSKNLEENRDSIFFLKKIEFSTIEIERFENAAKCFEYEWKDALSASLVRKLKDNKYYELNVYNKNARQDSLTDSNIILNISEPEVECFHAVFLVAFFYKKTGVAVNKIVICDFYENKWHISRSHDLFNP